MIAAAEILGGEHGIACEVWSVTSFSELAREAAAVEREARLGLAAPADRRPAAPRRSWLEDCLAGDTPIVAATDYVRALPQMVASYLPGRRFIALGTDGFGRSDSREKLRHFFEVNRKFIVVAALNELAKAGSIKPAVVSEAIKKLGLDPEKTNPLFA